MFYDHDKIERTTKRKQIGASMPKEDVTLWPMAISYLESRGLDPVCAQKNGWYGSRDAGDSVPRIVIPATNTKGLAYWQARAMENNAEPRYQSPPVPRGDSVIQVWPLNRNWLPVLVLCEGPCDALAAASGGVRAVALMGINPTEDTMDMIMSLAMDVERVTFFADRDAIPEAIEFMKRCMLRGLPVVVSNPQPYKDLAAIPKKKRDVLLALYTDSCMK